MNPLILYGIIFVIALLSLELIFFAIRMIRNPDRAEVRRRLRMSLEGFDEKEATDLYKKNLLSDIPFLNRILQFFPGIDSIRLELEQANVNFTLGLLVLLSLTLGLLGFLVGMFWNQGKLISLLIALIFAYLPKIYVGYKKRKRMAKFEEQLPEALGLIARALRSGHAFTSGMKLAADEFPDPLGPEFDETLDEINFGINVADALKNLAHRVDCADLKFFVVSVILQRETGGNLSEIMENLATLIRERFKFRGKIKVLTAEARMSATVLYILPVVLAAYLFFFQNDFIRPLYTDPIGKILLVITAVLMILGYFIIKRIIKIEV